MRIFFHVLTVLFFLTSCSLRPKSNEEMIQDIREDFSKQADIHNQETLGWKNLVDSLYKIANTNQNIALQNIDNLISKDHSLDQHKISQLHFIKGDIYYSMDSLPKSIEEFTKAGQGPKYLAARAGAYVKLEQYDKAITDLNSAAQINSDYLWNVGNFYEIIGNKDSAIANYTKLYNKDTTIYMYCQERITELKKSRPKLLTELVYHDRQRMIIFMEGIN